jgi:chemotaxis protein MotB
MPTLRNLPIRKLSVRNLHLRNLLGIGAIGILVAGCVPVETYQAERLKADQLAEQLGHSQSEVNEANARAESLQKQLAMLGNNSSTNSAMMANYANQIADLQKQNDLWQEKYNQAMGMVASEKGGSDTPALPAALDSELRQFAAQNPDLVDFDSARGIVKFKSDVTFAVGDATVTPKVKDVIGRFASILNSAGADSYELLVAGHTDSTPVTNENTKRHGHFDNWYLSSHRAIAVGEELIKDGVGSRRMGMVGYADKHPIASNASESGKAQNRRVEVLILPTTVHSSVGVASSDETKSHRTRAAAAPAPTATPARATMTKDTGVTYTK